jgi:hypothetical protein
LFQDNSLPKFSVTEVCELAEHFCPVFPIRPSWRLESLRYLCGFGPLRFPLKSSRMSDDTPKFRIGTVQHFNTVPLTRGIENEVVFATPARLAEMLWCGRELNLSP